MCVNMPFRLWQAQGTYTRPHTHTHTHTHIHTHTHTHIHTHTHTTQTHTHTHTKTHTHLQVGTVRAFRDRRYEYKALNKVHNGVLLLVPVH